MSASLTELTSRGVEEAIGAWTIIGRIWGRLSHDVNNHLASVLGNAELGAQSTNLERMQRCLATAAQGATEMKTVFGILSELAASAGPFAPQRDTLTEVIRPVERLFARGLQKANVSFIREIEAAPALTLDRRKLSLALAGLVAWMLDSLRGNGEVAGTGGEIRLRTEVGPAADGSDWTLRISLSARPAGGAESIGAPDGDSPEVSWARLVAGMHSGRLDMPAGGHGTDIELVLPLPRDRGALEKEKKPCA